MPVFAPGQQPRARSSSQQRVALEVLDRITGMLMSQEVAPGDRLNIDAIAHHLGVSATPVREALARLETLGLVEREHLKGYRARALLSRHELTDLCELRMLLEPHAAESACRSGTPAQLEAVALEFTHRPTPPEPSDQESYSAFRAHDSRLHRLILVAGGNPAITAAIDQTHFHLHAFRLGYDPAFTEQIEDEHRRVVEAVTSREPVAARESMLFHLERGRERLLRFTS